MDKTLNQVKLILQNFKYFCTLKLLNRLESCSQTIMEVFLMDKFHQVGQLFHILGSGFQLNFQFLGRLTSVKCFAQFLGRHFIALAQFPFSNLGRLESFLFAMEAAQDIICFRNIEVKYFPPKL